MITRTHGGAIPSVGSMRGIGEISHRIPLKALNQFGFRFKQIVMGENLKSVEFPVTKDDEIF